MKLPAQLPPTICWLPFSGTRAELRAWQAQHAPGFALRERLPRGVRLHTAISNPQQLFASWRLAGEAATPAIQPVRWCAAFDPVAMAADQTDVRIMQWPVSDLADAAATALVTDVATHLAGDDDPRLAHLSLWQPAAARWYVISDRAGPDIVNAQPERVLGQALRDVPTGGTDAALWRRISTEIQMLFHAHPVNAQRTANGQAPVTGLWWFGAGSVVSQTPTLSLVKLVSRDPLWRGCWHAHGAQAQVQTHADGPQSLAGVALAGNVHETLPKAVAALDAGELSALVIDADGDALTLARASLWQRLMTGRRA